MVQQPMVNQLQDLYLLDEDDKANLFQPLSQTGDQNENVQTELNIKEELTSFEEQLQVKVEQLRNNEKDSVDLRIRLEQDRKMVQQPMVNQLQDLYLLDEDDEANLFQPLSQTGDQKENTQTELMNIKEELTSCEEQLRVKGEQLRNNEKDRVDLRIRLRDSEGREESLRKQMTILKAAKEKETVNLQEKLTAKIQEVTTLERQLRDREQDVVELQTALSETEETLRRYESQLTTRDWVLSRDKIQMTEKVLGIGGSGRVVEGRYCGCAVAIKQLHELALTPLEQKVFEREMDIASRCRHPCLLQFIGATSDEGSPLFVTELMETSLRALLGKRSLSETEVAVIALDVARALNYLHEKTIVHRDVSSANVLLWLRDNKWRGKLSDYGTAKFVEEIMTKAPGNMSYSAPEAFSTSQTVKVSASSTILQFITVINGKTYVLKISSQNFIARTFQGYATGINPIK